MPAQDLGEPFDLCDRDGRPLGRTKPRGAVHRDGDWHRALHLWVVIAWEGGWMVVLQRRSHAKDSHPGLVDVSVAGHLRAGESIADALRESEEEIGLAVSLADTVPLGERRIEKRIAGGVDREVQTVLATVTRRQLHELRGDPDEVAALYAVPLADALAFARGELPALLGLGHADAPTTAVLTAADFIAGDESYRVRCLEALDALVHERPYAPLTLG